MDYSQNFKSEWSKYWVSEFSARKFMRPFGDKETKAKFMKLLNDFKPDVVHLNNIHTQISPLIAEIAHNKGIKIVWTLHDYKLLCPAYLCLNGKGKICEKCFDGDKSHCTKNRCIKNKWLHSFIAQKEAEKWNRERFEKCTDTFICPSNFMRQKMLQGGFNENKLHVMHNFVDINSLNTPRPALGEGNYYLYVGRISKEKGVSKLCSVASKLPYKLKVVGSGPLEKELREKYKQIEFLGSKKHDEVLEIMANARFTVVPSEYYENNPLSVMESLCLGVPVLGANIGGIPELADNLFESGDEDDLKIKIECMMNSECKFDNLQFAKNFGKESYLERLREVYRKT
jgi:glycosyltransferase involved in cell wall biosynthesis